MARFCQPAKLSAALTFRSRVSHTAGVDLLYQEFGRLLRKSRKEAKLTQGAVAERVGLSRTSITNIEKGRQHVLLHQLFLLASAVGVEPTELLPHGSAALDELLSARALRALPDEESRAFAARVLRRHSNQTERQAASG
jgi:transcriptional regulator with XRE-family HTH domain